MASVARPNVSDDLTWLITRNFNAFHVKKSSGGGSQFSRDPMNLTNKHTRQQAGYANSKAIGVQAAENGGIAVTTKNPNTPQAPAKTFNTTVASASKSNRNVYKGIANRATGNGYRADLRADAVARASALRQAQRPKKDIPENKPRGARARKAAEKDEA